MLKPKKIILSFYGIILCCFLFLGFIFYSEFSQRNLEFYVLDIGQGDAILIRTPQHYNILIDGGPDNKVVYKLGEYLPFYDRDIDLMVLTHPDGDHLIGLIEVLRRYKVKAVLLTGILDNSPPYLIWLELIKNKSIPVLIAGEIQNINLGLDLDLEIIYPFTSVHGQKLKDRNDSSIVAKLNYGQTSILLTGDASIKIEKELLAENVDVLADILKAGHHGSKTSSGYNFLKEVNPQIAIISCGLNNKFGHPHQEVIENLNNLGIEIFRTDLDGDFIFTLEK